MDADDRAESPDTTRRRLLATAGLAAGTGLAGCASLPGFGGDGPSEAPGLDAFRGSGPLVSARPEPGGTRIADLPDLAGDLTLYLGGGESGLYTDLIGLLEETYPEFSVSPRTDSSASLANTIVEEMQGSGSPADVFWAVDAGSLGVVADAGHTTELPADAVSAVPEQFRPDNRWVGVAGRARAVPYNTDELDESDIPGTVADFPDATQLRDAVGWAPTYGAFQSFVTAMRVLRGRDTTKQWLQGMLDLGVTEYNDEWFVSNAVADGEIAAGFANHYYAIRVMASRSDAPIDLAFTSGDAGALVNASGAAVVEGTDQSDLATNFVRHLLSAEAQEFFATRTFAYPMIPDVEPVGDLPTVEELSPPDVPLTALSDLQPTLELLREVGVL
jgi:iron(III) transport system substrate-binding protein